MSRKSPVAGAPPSPTSSAAATSADEEESESIASPTKPAAPEPSSSESESESSENDAAPPPPTANSDSDSDSESDSYSDPPAPPRHSNRVADPAIKPLATKPIPAPKPKAQSSSATSDTAAPKHHQRLWSEEDETAILVGLLDYYSDTGKVPVTASDMDPFYESVHKSFKIEVTKSQLCDKVRHLKRKYESTRSKPAKRHDGEIYELSHKVWGVKRAVSENGTASNKRQKTNVEEKIEDEGEDGTVVGKEEYPYLRRAFAQMGECLRSRGLLMEALELVEGSKAKELEKMLKKEKMLEAKQHIRKMDLARKVKKVATKALEKLE